MQYKYIKIKENPLFLYLFYIHNMLISKMCAKINKYINFVFKMQYQ